jgi:hypothetical protein
MILPQTNNSLLYRTGDCIRLPLPVPIVSIEELTQHTPTHLYKLKNRVLSLWEEIK